MPSSNPSSTCRLDWRPSALATGAVTLLAVLAAFAAWNSGLPRWVAATLSGAAILHGMRVARREWRHEPCSLCWWPGEDVLRIAFGGREEDWNSAHWQLRGPLATLAARDASGRRQSLFWWPDTLPATARRRLRLALDGPGAHCRRRSAS